jgi:chromate transporter
MPTVKGLFVSFFRLGLTAFGGPAMVAHIRELSTQRNQWLDEPDFKNGVALGQIALGPIIIGKIDDSRKCQGW